MMFVLQGSAFGKGKLKGLAPLPPVVLLTVNVQHRCVNIQYMIPSTGGEKHGVRACVTLWLLEVGFFSSAISKER